MKLKSKQPVLTCYQGWGDYITNLIEYEYDYFEIVRVRVPVSDTYSEILVNSLNLSVRTADVTLKKGIVPVAG